ncbi:MAG: biotin--[Muribaculaceae bacterium]|nr:biotin--[acetyl-CoA-carboxylase] ligase [Muribaculaceae bacterium]
MINYIGLEEAKSTNTYLLEHAPSLPDRTVVYTYRQTAGRGQKGNSWESEPGMNLAFSLLLKLPPMEVRKQFYISEAVSVAICDFLSQFADGFKVKWPNDIYHHDSKICGILIENSLDGKQIAHSVIGVGININQTRFVSDAPNPVSLKQITDNDYDLDQLLHDVCQRMSDLCLLEPDTLDALHNRYMRSLYRNDGRLYPWQLPDGTIIEAAIDHVATDGMLTLRHADGSLHNYAFKEVKHIINNITL